MRTTPSKYGGLLRRANRSCSLKKNNNSLKLVDVLLYNFKLLLDVSVGENILLDLGD